MLKLPISVFGRNGGKVKFEVGADSDSNVSMISKKMLKKCKLVKRDEAFKRMDQYLKNYARNLPAQIMTLAGSEKLGRMKFVEIFPMKSGDTDGNGLVVPVFN